MGYKTDCLHFNGYKPCGKNHHCHVECPHYQKRGLRILLVHLGALGAVVRSTALINPILRKYPRAQITWVTEAPAHHLLKGQPEIFRILTTSERDLLQLSALRFDVALVVDKSILATGVLRRTKARKIYGFIADEHGVIHPATPAATELWELGLNDDKKFVINSKTEIQLICEALELDYQKDDYNLPLANDEKELQYERWQKWSLNGQKLVVGINTGCAATISAKKLSIENHRELIRRLQKKSQYRIVLLGGPEDTFRNQQIASGVDVVQSPTELGLRDGLASVAACDAVITGDSLGLHMAISQKKTTIAWFGPTCPQEIELYGRGEKILTRASCGPCWKRTCHKPVMCYDLVELDDIINALERQLHKQELQTEIKFSRPDSLSG